MRVSIEEFKGFIQAVKDSVKEQAESVREVSYDFQFKISLDPVFNVTSSEVLSRLQALHDAVAKFNEAEFITWEIAIPVANRYSKDLQESIQKKMETKAALAAPSKLVTAEGK